MKTRRNPWFIPVLFYLGWTAVIGVSTYAGYKALERHYDEKKARATLDQQKQMESIGAYLGLGGLGVGIVILTIKGGLRPART